METETIFIIIFAIIIAQVIWAHYRITKQEKTIHVIKNILKATVNWDKKTNEEKDNFVREIWKKDHELRKSVERWFSWNNAYKKWKNKLKNSVN